MNTQTAEADTDGDTEGNRLQALANLWISGTPPEPRFDTILQLAAELFHTPMAFVTLVEKDMQGFKAMHGADFPDIPRCMSVCTHTIESGEVLVIDDMLEDPRFAGNPLVTGAPFLRFYAGTPLTTDEGLRIGALCILDTVPRHDFGDEQRKTLERLGSLVMEQMRLRRTEIIRSTVMNFSDATELAFFRDRRQWADRIRQSRRIDPVRLSTGRDDRPADRHHHSRPVFAAPIMRALRGCWQEARRG